MRVLAETFSRDTYDLQHIAGFLLSLFLTDLIMKLDNLGDLITDSEHWV